MMIFPVIGKLALMLSDDGEDHANFFLAENQEFPLSHARDQHGGGNRTCGKRTPQRLVADL